jgi:hypothetical protein
LKFEVRQQVFGERFDRVVEAKGTKTPIVFARFQTARSPLLRSWRKRKGSCFGTLFRRFLRLPAGFRYTKGGAVMATAPSPPSA